MSIKSRIDQLEQRINDNYILIDVDGSTLKVTEMAIFGVYHELLKSLRHSKERENELIDKGIMQAELGQHNILDLVLIIDKSINRSDLNDKL